MYRIENSRNTKLLLSMKIADRKIEIQSADEMLINDGRVIGASPVIFDRIVEMADEAFGEK